MSDEAVDQMDAAAEVLEQLATIGYEPDEMPARGDLADAIRDAGYRLAREG